MRPGTGGGRKRPSTSNNSDAHKNFKVVIRCRPPLTREIEKESSYKDCVQVINNGKGVVISQSLGDSNSNLYTTHRFTFDHVYGAGANQAEVYENTARDAVLSTLQGYNATILAYGQTGTGKTFTMEGYHDQRLRGIIPRAVEEIFNYIQNTAHENATFLVRVSYLQIYNQVISDLLKPERTNLQIREGKKRGVFVEGLSEWVVRSPSEVYGLIARGSNIRATGSTKMNPTSSRSHANFIIIVEQNEMVMSGGKDNRSGSSGSGQPSKRSDMQTSFRVGKLNLVDLAGSERVRISGATGKRLEESKNINSALSALGNVIAALTDRSGRRKYIPYRNDKLTRILEDSLGGNCKTTMMAMISPAPTSFLESLSTLKFANRAKNIKNTARINEDLDEKTLLRRYERELKRLRYELKTRSRNVVDKRTLLELEAQKRRAEQDKLAAMMNLEQLSRELLNEKKEKSKLQERIKQMSSQMLVGGSSVVETAEFKEAIRREQDRIRKVYQMKVSELEKEREAMEQEKVQTYRYKQLLLKQRDIMIQLTARLYERDQSILMMQEELDAYDREQRLMEEILRSKSQVITTEQAEQLKKLGIGSREQDRAAAAQRPSARGNAGGAGDESAGDGPDDDVIFSPNKPSASSRSESDERKGAGIDGTNGLSLEAVFEEIRLLRARLLQSETENNSLKGMVRQLQTSTDTQNENTPAPSDRQNVKSGLKTVELQSQVSQLRSQCDAHVKERRALQVIIEQKMKTLVDSIADATIPGGRSHGSQTGFSPQVLQEIQILRRLVNASVDALNQSRNTGRPAGGSNVQQQRGSRSNVRTVDVRLGV